jgi:two-component system KDP operon response regulator KdpE
MADHAIAILVADHDPRIRRLLKRALLQRGYRCVQASSGDAVMECFGQAAPDAIILELGMPGGTAGRDGFALIKAVRRLAPTPILVVSSRVDVAAKVRALDLGAADYITKPFDMDELLARLKAALRHGLQVTGEAPVFRCGALAVDLVARQVSLDGTDVHLTRMEYKVLRCLVGHAGRLVTHRQLCHAIWGTERPGNVPYLRELISQLRRKIDPGARLIVTDARVGYRLVTA